MARPRKGSAYEKRGVIYVSVTLRDGRWARPCPPRRDGVPVDLIHARAVAAELQRRYDAHEWTPELEAKQLVPPTPTSPTGTNAPTSDQPATSGAGKTVLAFVREWAHAQRYETAPKDQRTVERYLRPAAIAALPIADLKPKHVLGFISWLRDYPSARGGTLAPRTVRNAYDVLRRALDAAVIEELVVANPCHAIRGRLPSIEDKNPLARESWLYPREDVVRLLTDERILPVRRVAYALQFLTGLRIGELAVLRFRDYDPMMKPLGRLTIARAVKSVSGKEAQTKTAAIKRVPVHPTLAVILDEWKARGWAAYMGRAPEAGDLVVPNQHGRPRNTNRHNRDLGRDCRRIGVTRRHQHAMRHTFISLVQDDGADGSVIRWITHAPPRTAFDGYTRGQWTRLCAELEKLAIGLGASTTR